MATEYELFYVCDKCGNHIKAHGVRTKWKKEIPKDTIMICNATKLGECNTAMCERAHPHKLNAHCITTCEGIGKYHCVPVVEAPADAKDGDA